MAIQERRIIDLLDTIWAIAASPYVAGYTIGYTSRSGHDRFKEHRTNGYHHLVILADKLEQKEATKLEVTLQARIREDRRFTAYRKYDPDRRDGPIFPSIGNPKTDNTFEQTHSVYMAWWEPE